MEALSLIDHVIADWKLLVFAFAVGGFYYQAKIWFKKLTDALETSGQVHSEQNASLSGLHQKLDNLDKRVARIEGTVEILKIDNQTQEVKIAVLEAQTQVIDHPVKRRTRRQQS
jgi:TolA-binding protein